MDGYVSSLLKLLCCYLSLFCNLVIRVLHDFILYFSVCRAQIPGIEKNSKKKNEEKDKKKHSEKSAQKAYKKIWNK